MGEREGKGPGENEREEGESENEGKDRGEKGEREREREEMAVQRFFVQFRQMPSSVLAAPIYLSGRESEPRPFLRERRRRRRPKSTFPRKKDRTVSGRS